MIFKKIYIYHCIERTEHVLEELDISAIKVYVYYYYYYNDIHNNHRRYTL